MILTTFYNGFLSFQPSKDQTKCCSCSKLEHYELEQFEKKQKKFSENEAYGLFMFFMSLVMNISFSYPFQRGLIVKPFE